MSLDSVLSSEDRHPDASALRLKLVLALIAHNPKHPLLDPVTWLWTFSGVRALVERAWSFLLQVFSPVSTSTWLLQTSSNCSGLNLDSVLLDLLMGFDVWVDEDNKLIQSDYSDYLLKLTHISQSCQLQLREEGRRSQNREINRDNQRTFTRKSICETRVGRTAESVRVSDACFLLFKHVLRSTSMLSWPIQLRKASCCEICRRWAARRLSQQRDLSSGLVGFLLTFKT